MKYLFETAEDATIDMLKRTSFAIEYDFKEIIKTFKITLIVFLLCIRVEKYNEICESDLRERVNELIEEAPLMVEIGTNLLLSFKNAYQKDNDEMEVTCRECSEQVDIEYRDLLLKQPELTN